MDVSKIRPVYLRGGYTISKIPEAKSQRAALLEFQKNTPLNKDELELLSLLEQWFAAKKKPNPLEPNREGYEAEDEALQSRFEEVYHALDVEQKARWHAEQEQKERAEKHPGKFVRGAVFEIVGTRISGGKRGNHYEVAARDVVFDEWNKQGLLLGEKMFCIDSSSHFYVVLQDHSRWGIFVPRDKKDGYPEISDLEKTLAWYRRDGEQPKIENDDPGTYHYEEQDQAVIFGLIKAGVLKRVKH